MPSMLTTKAPATQMFLSIRVLLHRTADLPEYLAIAEKEDVHRAVCDYISGMSDGYAVDLYQELFIPKSWKS